MAGHFLTGSGPPELLVHILRFAESPRDVLSFALTCRFMSDVWYADAAGYAVVWRLWLREMPYAAEALAVVRGTAVIVNAEKKGELPPKAIGLPRPGGETRARPDASDLMAVRQMQRYVDGLTLRFRCGDYRFPSDLYGGAKPEELDRMPEWRDGVQRAIYRALIITTALVGAYREPLFEAKRSQSEELRSFFTQESKRPSSEALDFLHSFPVYKLHPTQEEGNQTFGFLANWLLEHILADATNRKAMEENFEGLRGRAIECHVRGECPLAASDISLSHSDAHFITLEMMRVLWMCENITEQVTTLTLRNKSNKTLHTVGPIAIFGEFSLRIVEYTAAHDSGNFGTEFSSTVFQARKDGDYEVYIPGLLDWIHMCSGELNHFADSLAPTTPLRLRFFEHFLREYVDAAFIEGLFVQEEGQEAQDTFQVFLHCATLFALDDVESRQRTEDEDPVYNSGYLTDVAFLDGSEVLNKADLSISLTYL